MLVTSVSHGHNERDPVKNLESMLATREARGASGEMPK